LSIRSHFLTSSVCSFRSQYICLSYFPCSLPPSLFDTHNYQLLSPVLSLTLSLPLSLCVCVSVSVCVCVCARSVVYVLVYLCVMYLTTCRYVHASVCVCGVRGCAASGCGGVGGCVVGGGGGGVWRGGGSESSRAERAKSRTHR